MAHVLLQVEQVKVLGLEGPSLPHQVPGPMEPLVQQVHLEPGPLLLVRLELLQLEQVAREGLLP